MEKINIGIVGACGRGASFKAACDALENVRIQAVCDINDRELDRAAVRLGALEKYADYPTMLDKSELHAVIIATPMPLHAPQAMAALDRGLHVLSEVPAGVSMEECRALVLACARSRGVYMMAENYVYMRPNAVVCELARRGLFGAPYYAEGEYIHELKGLNEITPWRRKWQTGINGVTYGTHSLGPILQWMPGDRVVSVCCAGSGHHYKDPRGDVYDNEDSCVMLGKLRSGGLVKIRVDMLSDRPHAMTNYSLQGTDGCYESARAQGERHRVWLRARCKDPNTWLDLADIVNEFMPEMWRREGEQAEKAGHGGGDYFEILDFADAILGKRACPIGIHEAMDMTLPGLASQQSIREGGRWIEVPDSRTWLTGPPMPQLMMIWPPDRLASPPEPNVPSGYVLRQWTEADTDAYLALMANAGFKNWNRDRLVETQKRILPDGFFVIEHRASGELVATAMATHNPLPQTPYGAELGWVAADAAHRGKGLGLAVSAAVTALLLRRGYRNICLRTDDWRLAAIKTYLRLGYQPIFYESGMEERWCQVRAQIGL